MDRRNRPRLPNLTRKAGTAEGNAGQTNATLTITAAGCIKDTAGDGCLAQGSLWGAHSVRVSPDGKSVYVASLLSHSLSVFKRAPDGTR